MQEQYDKKVEDKLLKYFYKRHVARFNKTKSMVGNENISLFDDDLKKEVPEIFFDLSNPVPDCNARYFQELKHKGFMKSINTFSSTLTVEGYDEAERMKHPIKQFLLKHPDITKGVLIGIFVTFTGTLLFYFIAYYFFPHLLNITK